MVGPYEGPNANQQELASQKGILAKARGPNAIDLSTTTTLITQQLRTGSPNFKALIFLMLDHHVYMHTVFRFELFSWQCYIHGPYLLSY